MLITISFNGNHLHVQWGFFMDRFTGITILTDGDNALFAYLLELEESSIAFNSKYIYIYIYLIGN